VRTGGQAPGATGKPKLRFGVFSRTVAERDRKRGNTNVCVDSFKAIML
jgi:hypothetical protein